MDYYCNECKKTISKEEFCYSMNRYKKALCRTHQSSTLVQGATRDLQELVRERHKDELTTEVPVLRSVKDWIAADLETWEKVLNNEGEGGFIVKGNGEEKKGPGRRGRK